MSMTILGDKTPRTVIYKSESHKLAHSFPVKENEKVLPGQQVVLNTDGTIQGFKTGDSLSKIIGMAISSSETPAYKANKQYGVVEATVALSGHAIINAASGGALSAGPVKPNGSLYNSNYPKYVVLADGDPTVAISLTEATGADEMIQVLVL